MSKRPAEDEQRASVKAAKAEPAEPPDIDVPALATWLEGWMKEHAPPQGWRDPSLSLDENIASHVDENEFANFVSALKSEQSVCIDNDELKSDLQDKWCNTLCDFIRCKALSEFVSEEFTPGFHNRKQLREFEKRLEEGLVDQLQFDVVYDFAIYIATNGVEDSEESDDEEPVEEEDSEHSDSEDSEEDSEDSGESGEESESE